MEHKIPPNRRREGDYDQNEAKARARVEIDQKVIELRDKGYIIKLLKKRLSSINNNQPEDVSGDNQEIEQNRTESYINSLSPKEAEELLKQKEVEYVNLETRLVELSKII